MKFDWNYYITKLLLRSEDKTLKNEANDIITAFNLLEGQIIETLKNPGILEYGFWLSDRNIDSYLEYSVYNSLSRGTIFEESVGLEILNNIFEIKGGKTEFYKVAGDSFIRVEIEKLTEEKKYKVTQKIYENINELFGIIFSKYSMPNNEFRYYKEELINTLKRIGNNNLFVLNIRTMDAIIDDIKLLPDIEEEKEYLIDDNTYLEISKDVYSNLENLNPKVKRK